MTAWFADTFFFVALLNEEDQAHHEALNLIDRLPDQLITTCWVITELADGLSKPSHRQKLKPLLEFLRSHPAVVIVPPDEHLFREGLELYYDRPDKSWSLTDCISFTVMQEQGIADALTGDHHFEQAGFHVMFKA